MLECSLIELEITPNAIEINAKNIDKMSFTETFIPSISFFTILPSGETVKILSTISRRSSLTSTVPIRT